MEYWNRIFSIVISLLYRPRYHECVARGPMEMSDYLSCRVLMRRNNIRPSFEEPRDKYYRYYTKLGIVKSYDRWKQHQLKRKVNDYLEPLCGGFLLWCCPFPTEISLQGDLFREGDGTDG